MCTPVLEHDVGVWVGTDKETKRDRERENGRTRDRETERRRETEIEKWNSGF